ncbi:hypothetical protein BGZ83_002785 [Gryganskiella cystojenkinii]|nr:hypothetical protein BGZ83_002785 [Gryganskiella cystojenkinii]
MLHISPISRPDRFLNEEMPFVNTAGSMNFSLTSPGLLHLDSYQRTLQTLIQVLHGIHQKNQQRSQRKSRRRSSASQQDKDENVFMAIDKESTEANKAIVEVPLGNGGFFALDLSVTEPGFGTLTEGGSANAVAAAAAASPRLSQSQAYPLTFMVTSLSSSPAEVGATRSSSGGAVLYYIRLPLNPLTQPIQCQLSARRLCTQHVSVLDRILRRLCDASPGAFMVGYSDGISGVDAGKEVVYSGENSALHHHPHQHQQQHNHHHHHVQHHNHHNNLEQSIAHSRDHGSMEIDSRVAGLVGHVEHHHHTSPVAQSPPRPASLTKPIKDNSTTKPALETVDVVSSLEITSATRTTATTSVTVLGGENQEDKAFRQKLLEEERFIANHDFGMVDDIEMLLDAQASMNLDDLHDMIWATNK